MRDWGPRKLLLELPSDIENCQTQRKRLAYSLMAMRSYVLAVGNTDQDDIEIRGDASPGS